MSMPNPHILTVASEFSRTPGPRSRGEGRFSGEEFLQEHLLPRFRAAVQDSTKLIVDLDGAAGYATSFLEAAFGGLVRNSEYSSDVILSTLEIKSDEEPYLVEEIQRYIREARR